MTVLPTLPTSGEVAASSSPPGLLPNAGSLALREWSRKPGGSHIPQ